MSKLRAIVVPFVLAVAAFVAPVPAVAALGPDAAVCARGDAPALLVRVDGLKERSGRVRVQSYGGSPARYFDKGSYLKRIDVAVPARGAVEVCVPVPGPGTYAVSVRHDVNGNGKSDMKDGGGMSGNPEMSTSDVVFRRKPDPKRVAVAVGAAVRQVPVTLRYMQGGSFRPIGG